MPTLDRARSPRYPELTCIVPSARPDGPTAQQPAPSAPRRRRKPSHIPSTGRPSSSSAPGAKLSACPNLIPGRPNPPLVRKTRWRTAAARWGSALTEALIECDALRPNSVVLDLDAAFPAHWPIFKPARSSLCPRKSSCHGRSPLAIVFWGLMFTLNSTTGPIPETPLFLSVAAFFAPANHISLAAPPSAIENIALCAG